jgi:predicted component of type VI protein secretion system
MEWILIPTSEDLGYERGTADGLSGLLSRLGRSAAAMKALQIAAALGADVENRYRTVNELLLRGVSDELKRRIHILQKGSSGARYVFFEPWQQLLLARHLSRFGSDAPDALDPESAEGREVFVEACRVVNDLSMPPAPALSGDAVTDALIVAANIIPRLWLLNPPQMNNAQARLLSFLEVIPREHPERADASAMLRDRFNEVLGVPFEDVIDLTAFLGYWSISQGAQAILRDLNVVRVAPEVWLQQTNLSRDTFEQFVARISQPFTELSPEAPPGAASSWWDPLGFRDRPLIRFEDGSFVIAMPELLMEKGGFDMFWWLTEGPGGSSQVRAWQEAFGRLCEAYVLDLLRVTEDGHVFPNVRWATGEIDALIWSRDRLAVVEVCSGFMANAPKMSGDYFRLRDELTRRYVERTNTDGSIDREAVAQIARDVEWLLTCRRADDGHPLPLRGVETIHPVVIASDRAARTHGLWRFLDSELRRRLPASMPWTVAPLAILGLEDLEWIEQAARDRHQRLQGVVPPVLQTLLWWQFDVSRYPAFWQLLEDVLGEPQPNSRLRELFESRREQMQTRFRRQ